MTGVQAPLVEPVWEQGYPSGVARSVTTMMRSWRVVAPPTEPTFYFFNYLSELSSCLTHNGNGIIDILACSVQRLQ